MNEKVEYVKAARQTRPHTCHWPDCNKQVPPAMWGCTKHWFMLPARLRYKVWHSYVPGQEIDMDVTPAYIEVAREIQEWIKEHEARSGI